MFDQPHRLAPQPPSKSTRDASTSTDGSWEILQAKEHALIDVGGDQRMLFAKRLQELARREMAVAAREQAARRHEDALLARESKLVQREANAQAKQSGPSAFSLDERVGMFRR